MAKKRETKLRFWSENGDQRHI